MKLIECPRDAMQGLEGFIPTAQKVRYINTLLEVGFDTIDFGSFVSSKAIPQMRDTAEVLAQLNWQQSRSKLLAIVANKRGAEEASLHEGITYLGFPLSISETFQQRNTNKSIAEALNAVAEIQELCAQRNKQQVVYISMGFGNPYGDPYDAGVVAQFVDILYTLGIGIVSLADTIGAANPENITHLFGNLTRTYPNLEIGVHLHSNPATAHEKIEAAWKAGCRRFDGAIKGYGGCPMANDELVGNLATETIIAFLDSVGATPYLNRKALAEALRISSEIFPNH
ncbi:MAG: hydroxymethylglutaryl-CoA lyase [Flammeovirgaceae bacterium]|nr:MAG: hydroxymethylglutaryl-CoA lyase [Flammeovirgaceae bacterium]